MVSIKIYKLGSLIDDFIFKSQFTFLNATQGENWHYDGPRTGEPGVIILWLKHDFDDKYIITFVRPDWQMTIGSQVYERQFYMDIEINDVPITLEWQDYRLEMVRV